VLTASTARRIVVEVLEAYGSAPENAAVVADHLVTSDLAGVRSHGFIRLPQYVAEILAGETDPVARPVRRSEGQGGRSSMRPAVSVRSPVSRRLSWLRRRRRLPALGLVTVHEAGHTGRIGAYAEQLAERGCLAIVVCSGARMGHRVALANHQHHAPSSSGTPSLNRGPLAEVNRLPTFTKTPDPLNRLSPTACSTLRCRPRTSRTSTTTTATKSHPGSRL